jgi:hypothetical protein
MGQRLSCLRLLFVWVLIDRLLTESSQVNMSIAILPMSAEFGWSPATVGLIQSSFFWGYLLTQVHCYYCTYIFFYALITCVFVRSQQPCPVCIQNWDLIFQICSADSWRHLGWPVWWQGSTWIWGYMVVSGNNSYTHCCQAWPSVPTHRARFHGDRRGWCLLLSIYVFLCYSSDAYRTYTLKWYGPWLLR